MNFIKGAGILLSIGITIFIIGLYGLGWKKFFLPREENIEREVFEQTKSYVHGGIQDLAKYYEEYQKANDQEREIIRSVIQNRFAEFDLLNIRSSKLRNFLVEMRGF